MCNVEDRHQRAADVPGHLAPFFISIYRYRYLIVAHSESVWRTIEEALLAELERQVHQMDKWVLPDKYINFNATKVVACVGVGACMRRRAEFAQAVTGTAVCEAFNHKRLIGRGDAKADQLPKVSHGLGYTHEQYHTI